MADLAIGTRDGLTFDTARPEGVADDATALPLALSATLNMTFNLAPIGGTENDILVAGDWFTTNLPAGASDASYGAVLDVWQADPSTGLPTQTKIGEAFVSGGVVTVRLTQGTDTAIGTPASLQGYLTIPVSVDSAYASDAPAPITWVLQTGADGSQQSVQLAVPSRLDVLASWGVTPAEPSEPVEGSEPTESGDPAEPTETDEGSEQGGEPSVPTSSEADNSASSDAADATEPGAPTDSADGEVVGGPGMDASSVADGSVLPGADLSSTDDQATSSDSSAEPGAGVAGSAAGDAGASSSAAADSAGLERGRLQLVERLRRERRHGGRHGCRQQ